MSKSASVKSLEKKLEQVRSQLAAAKAREKAQKRKDETRRKILVGAYFLEQAQTEKKYAELVEKLDAFLTKAADRKLFGLPADKSSKQKTTGNDPEKPAG